MTITDPTPAHVPDVLETLAQLPNDEVYTPPKLVNAMLDVLPDHVWSEPDYKWLDPATKSGVYLREIARRLMVGLAEWEPDGAKRRDHILRHMVYGAAITQMSGEIARRSLYQTKNATGADIKDPALADLVVHLDASDGNVPFVETEHVIDPDGRQKGKACELCRAPVALIRKQRESFAYSFIHSTYPTEELADVEFDVIVGNPPYQIGVEGNTRTKPLYNLFVQRAVALNPKYLLMITPSRWFTGGLGLDSFRKSMLADRRLRVMVDNPKLFDVFPQAEIKGGVSYFLWDRDHDGDCEFSTRIDGAITSTMRRDLRRGKGVLVRSNEAEQIIEKVLAKGEDSLESIVSSQKPFGLLSNFRDFTTSPAQGSDAIRLWKRDRAEAWVLRDQVAQGADLVGDWKVLTPEAGDGHGRVPALVTGNPFVVGPNSACTQTFLVVGTHPDAETAERAAEYLRTKFVRFLVHARKASQHTTSDTYAFVPALDFGEDWTDEKLYERYELTAAERAHIEEQIRDLSRTDVVEIPDADEEDEDDE